MKRGLAELYSIAATEFARSAWFELDNVINDGPVNRAEILYLKYVPFAVNARVPPGNLCVRIESGQVHLGKYI